MNELLTTTVTPSYKVAIRTRYLGPTNYRGPRVVAWRADKSSSRSDPSSVTISWDADLDMQENHLAAITAYIDGHNAAGHDWSGRWVTGATNEGYVATWDGYILGDTNNEGEES
jgi:PhoPQ-activated pathogenicity-related protein